MQLAEPRLVAVRVPAIALVLLAGLLLRLVIAYVIWPGEGLKNDLLLLTGWAQSLSDHGPAGFYGNTPLADYPPGYLWVLWIEGLLGNAIAGVLGQGPTDVIAALHKLPAIGADLLIALLLYNAASRWRDQKTGLAAAALYLFNPVTAYNSALWGQVDSVGALLLLSAMLLLIYGWSEAAVVMAVLAAVTKPQYAIGLAIVGAILLRRHLLQPGSGPTPVFGLRLARLDARIGGRLRSWLVGRQGFERLLGCALVAFVAFFAAILPFDLPVLTSNELAGIPFVGHVAGLVALVSTLAGAHEAVTANAFNFWALVGPTPLTHALNNTYIWTYDSLTVLGPLSAASVGFLLLALVGIVTVVTLLLRDDRETVLIAFTVLAVAFFALPTRAHERYLFPAFASGALLAATSIRWRWWLLILGLLNVANLHAILTMPVEGYATPGLVDLFPGRLLRDDAAVTLISIGHTLAFGALLVAFVRVSVWPAVLDLRQRGWAGIWRTTPASASSAESRALVLRAQRARLQPSSAPPVPASAAGRSAERSAGSTVAEPGGRLDRRDLAVFALLVAVTFGTRAWRLELPRTEYFDEYWHATTATEFLQDWRYGIPHAVFEWTHPHLAKYAMAASIAAFGDNTARDAGSLGTPVRDAVMVAASPLAGDPGALVGDHLIVVTGADVRIAPHGKLDAAVVVPLQGASAVAADPAQYRAFVGTDAGAIYLFNGPSIEASATVTLRPQLVAQIGTPIIDLWVAGTDRLIAQSPGDQLSLLDASNGSVLATAHFGGISDVLPLTTPNGSQIAIASIPSGLVELDLTSLGSVATLPLRAPPIGLDLVDGSDQGHRERELLFRPTLYVATGAARVETVVLGADGTLQTAGGFPMPGPVTDVRWDRTTNLVHVLGKTRDGIATIYVVDPHSNAVFADAVLPFDPAVWLLDVEPGAPSLDRQRALAISAIGEIQSVNVGNNAFAWRLPGVVAGALMAGLLYLLTRLLFSRRLVGLLVAALVPVEGLLFAQSRIAMNDAYVGLFIVAAFTLLAFLLQSAASGLRARLEVVLGLPALGVLLGLALASKWVAGYAMGGVVLLVLLRSPMGRWFAFAGMVGLTTVFGYLAVADSPPNIPFFVIMLVLTALFAIAMARRGTALRSLRHEPIQERWVEPRWRWGLPFGWALACLTLLPLVVYVVSYLPWAIGTAGEPQLVAGWPRGHTGQTFLDLQAQMYQYHNELRAPHGASSPWWAWPLDLKPIWGYLEGFVDGTQATIFGTGNVVLLWLAIPAVAFGAWQAWRRHSYGLAFVAIAFFCLWLPWARIDRVSYNYHYYVALPFALVLLAYFLAELWDGPSARTWLLARAAAVAVLLGPAVLWVLRTPFCALAGVDVANPGSPVCGEPVSAFAIPVIGWLIGAMIVGVFVWRLRRPRWLVGGIVAAAAVTFVALYPALAAWRIPDGVAWVYQGLVPSWDSSFYFNNNQTPVAVIPLLTPGLLAVLVVTGLVAAGAMRLARRWRGPPPPPDNAAPELGPVARLRGRMAGPSAPSRLQAVELHAPMSDVKVPAAASASVAVPRFPWFWSGTSAPRPIGLPVLIESRGRALDRFGIPIALFGLSWLVYSWINSGRPAYFDYFIPLADAFLHGRLGLLSEPSGFTELVPGVNGLLNVVYPPGPAILLMPIVLVFGSGFDQASVSIVLGAANVAIASIVIAGMGVRRWMRVVLSLTFAFGTIVWFSAQIGTSWHFAHVVAIFFTLLAMLACQRDSPTWLIGLLFGLAVLSRLPVVLAAPFFLAYLADRSIRESRGEPPGFGKIDAGQLVAFRDRIPLKRFLHLAIPWAVGAGVLATAYFAYNWLRFGSIIETGDALVRQTEYSMEHGLLSVFHLPRLLVAMFLSGPAQVDGFPFFQPRVVGGLSILVTSPIFLWALKSRRTTWFTVGAWVSVVLVLVPILLHVDEGGTQFGFRYAQDVYPFLFLLTVAGLAGRIGGAAWVAIGFGVLVNVWGMASAYYNWWSLTIPDSQVPFLEVGSLRFAIIAGLVAMFVASVTWRSGRSESRILPSARPLDDVPIPGRSAVTEQAIWTERSRQSGDLSPLAEQRAFPTSRMVPVANASADCIPADASALHGRTGSFNQFWLTVMRGPTTFGFLLLAGGLATATFLLGWWVLYQRWWVNYSELIRNGSGLFQAVGEAVINGLLPYRDFAPVYPPAALPVLVIPSLLGPDYRAEFERLMLLLGALVIVLALMILVSLGAGRARIALAVGFIAASPVLVGQLMFDRFDLWPALITVGALLAVVAGHHRLGFAVLAVAVLAKVYPAVLVGLLFAYVWRRHGRREALICAVYGLSSAVLIVLPFLVIAPDGLWQSLFALVQRPLQVESLGAAVMFVVSDLSGASLALGHWGGSDIVVGPLADAVAGIQFVGLTAAVVTVWVWFARGRADRERLMQASAAAVCAYIAFGKVLSPQYLIWLVPMVPLVSGRRGLAAAGILGAALLLTQVYMPGRWFDWLGGSDPTVSWIVLARDLMLVGLLAILLLPSSFAGTAAGTRAFSDRSAVFDGLRRSRPDVSRATVLRSLMVFSLAVAAVTVVYQVLTTERLTIREGCGFDGGQYCAMAAGQLALEPFNRRILLPFVVGQIGPPGADGFALVNGFIIIAGLCAFAYLAVMNGGRAKVQLVGPAIAFTSLIFFSSRNTWHLYLSQPALSDFLALLFLLVGCIALIRMSDDERWSLIAAGAAFGGALSRENLALILGAVAIFAAASKTSRWRGVVPVLVAGLAGTVIAFSQPTLSIEHQTVFGVLAEWIGKDFGDAEGFVRFAVMFLLGVGPFAVVCFLWAREVWRDRTGRVALATAIIFIAVSVFAGGDTDRILMPAGLLFAVCVLRLFLNGVIPFASVILLVGANWIWQLPLVQFSGDQYEWLTFWGLRVTPLGDVLRYGLVPILVGLPLVLVAIWLRSPSESVARASVES